MVRVERSLPAPESLRNEAEKVNGSYSKEDVVERLRTDFHEKCYICEMKELQDPQIEHLLPHRNGMYKDRKFDWNNLFWSCGHCNGVKNQEKYAEGILDCCKRDPEDAIRFVLREKDVCVTAINEKDREAVLTAELVQEVFNIRNTGMRVYTSALRLKKLQEEMNVLYAKLDEYKEKPESRILLRTLKALLKRETAFAGFKRCYVRTHLGEFPELVDDVV